VAGYGRLSLRLLSQVMITVEPIWYTSTYGCVMLMVTVIISLNCRMYEDRGSPRSVGAY
jgi:Ca2+-dependent lipid-binding protein